MSGSGLLYGGIGGSRARGRCAGSGADAEAAGTARRDPGASCDRPAVHPRYPDRRPDRRSPPFQAARLAAGHGSRLSPALRSHFPAAQAGRCGQPRGLDVGPCAGQSRHSCLVVLGSIGALLALRHPALLVLTGGAGAAAGFFLPDVLLYNSGLKRQQRLAISLPEGLDLLTICVEAGLGFDAALAQVARNLRGPLAAEFARVLQEMQIGKSRAEAMRAMAERYERARAAGVRLGADPVQPSWVSRLPMCCASKPRKCGCGAVSEPRRKRRRFR